MALTSEQRQELNGLLDEVVAKTAHLHSEFTRDYPKDEKIRLSQMLMAAREEVLMFVENIQ